ncbi:DUF2284 domain-containing protein [Crassaminicella thermophila]|uniref:DUF2284 domain-containing protein n=1 Tax=Crassaminicella thermophila TaxID=2599308 RepID=A0A5C0SCT9_CRATE|nr:DUF2284 domain-containing protein [Crassaminicella thermophila]QEK11024.1 DUF2284 domain-containing protein [Crassaminicella thermophila]
MDKIKVLKNYINTKNIDFMQEISPKELLVSQKVRDACIKNKCGQYNNNFMCPPYVGEIEDFLKKLEGYTKGFLIFVKDKIDDPSDLNQFYKSATILHEIMLDIEKKGKELGFHKAFALIGGNCRLCDVCNAKLGKDNCINPKMARPSLEAVGIDVIHTCSQKGITIEFRKDEVIWVGLLLV